jgi:L-asparaginase
VCFGGHILRGNRCIKRSAVDLDAFASPNLPALGEVTEGVVVLNIDSLLPMAEKPFDVAVVQPKVASLRRGLTGNGVWAIQLHPGFPASLLHAALALPYAPRGWVLACYGSGNAPEDADFLQALQRARERGVVVVAVTQTGHGSVKLETYQAGSGLAQAGVVSGADMSLPSALAKMQLLLANGLSYSEVVAAMTVALAGEMS